MSLPKRCIFIAIATTVSIILISKSQVWLERFTTVQAESPPKSKNFTIQILMWTGWFYKVPEGRLADCDRPNCFLTTNRSTLGDSQAIVFHSRNLIWSDIPKNRRHDQSFVFFNWEPPYRTGGYFDTDWKKWYFNLTMTYRRDSDIYAPYGKVIKRQSPLNFDLKNLAANKTKPVAWLVSNCHTPSGREVLVEKLQKYISVDIYGACGKLQCPNGGGCGNLFNKDYKFYLSFENSLCKDYITEKFFQHLQNFVVPVVLERKHFEKFCPEYKKPWFIAADDFKNVKEMAKYLNYLNSNFTAYYEYLSWHETYQTELIHRSSADAFEPKTHWCDLCKVVANRNWRSVKNVVEWWWGNGACDHSYKLFHDFIFVDQGA